VKFDIREWTGKIWREGEDLGLPLHAKFCKNRLRGYTPLGQIYIRLSVYSSNVSPLRGEKPIFGLLSKRTE